MYKIFLGLILASSPIANAIEQILDLHSQIKINHDCSLNITESITVQVEHHQIKRGITRTIPINYQNYWGVRHSTDVHIQQILLDGLPVPYQSQIIGDSLFVKIGSPDKLVSLGEHTYQINYHVDRMLFFNQQIAELYFNVIGSDVNFPILQAKASLYLPQTVADQSIELAGYTGPTNSKQTNFYKWIDQDGAIQFQTTQRLRPQEAFTISVAFPKAILAWPPHRIQVGWFLKDNGLALILLFSLILLLIIAGKLFWQRYQNNPVITPRFSPPQDLLPWQLGYLYYLGHHPNIFTATLVDLAVKGYLTIQPQKTAAFNWLNPANLPGTTSYELIKSETPTEPAALYTKLTEALFPPQTTGSTTRLILEKNGSKTKTFEALLAPNPYQKQLRSMANSATFLLAIFNIVLAGLLLHLNHNWLVAITALLLSVLILICTSTFYTSYTGEAGQLQIETLGFKMYLETAEKKRLEKLNAPTQTIELYEKYLPYAIALGVDEQWSEAFGQLFAQIGAYQPYWYGRSRFYPKNINQFHSDLNSLASKKYYTGSSGQSTSKGGGGGYSGGGRGGGGIGGW
jgi:uncharacterized membrane protein YgcG